MREQVQWGNLGQRVRRAPMSGEGARTAESAGPLDGVGSRCVLRPLERQRGGDVCGTLLVEKGDEVGKIATRVVRPEAERASKSQILLNCVAEGSHRAPPGHGKASVRNAARSTLA